MPSDIPDGVRLVKGQRYGCDRKRQALDLYLPAGSGPWPRSPVRASPQGAARYLRTVSPCVPRSAPQDPWQPRYRAAHMWQRSRPRARTGTREAPRASEPQPM